MITTKQLRDIELLDQTIEIIADGKESEFCEYSGIAPSTIRTWRNRASIPQDKILLLKWITKCYKAEEKLKVANDFFEAFSKKEGAEWWNTND